MQRPEQVEAGEEEEAMREQGTRRPGARQGAEHDIVQPIGKQPPTEEEEHTEEPERAPSFLSARELQARKPAKGESQQGAGERSERKPRPK
jgi:hypothetical protein